MIQASQGGSSRPLGGVGGLLRRDLGELRDVKAPIGWRLKNLWGRRHGLPALAASQFLGRVVGASTIQARLHGTVYRPDWARLAPEQILRLKVLLQARTALTAEQTAAMLRELGGVVDVRQLLGSFGGDLTDFGLLSTRLVTDVGVGYIVDAFQNGVELENMKYHGYGTGTTAENQTDTALVTELTTEYVVNSTRPTGTTTEGASANIYRTVATLSPDSGGTLAITEHGVFSASSAGVLLDRSKFSAINLVASSDSLQTTYELTLTAGG